MALLEQWRSSAYSETANKGELQRMWAAYFQKEKIQGELHHPFFMFSLFSYLLYIFFVLVVINYSY